MKIDFIKTREGIITKEYVGNIEVRERKVTIKLLIYMVTKFWEYEISSPNGVLIKTGVILHGSRQQKIDKITGELGLIFDSDWQT